MKDYQQNYEKKMVAIVHTDYPNRFIYPFPQMEVC